MLLHTLAILIYNYFLILDIIFEFLYRFRFFSADFRARKEQQIVVRSRRGLLVLTIRIVFFNNKPHATCRAHRNRPSETGIISSICIFKKKRKENVIFFEFRSVRRSNKKGKRISNISETRVCRFCSLPPQSRTKFPFGPRPSTDSEQSEHTIRPGCPLHRDRRRREAKRGEEEEEEIVDDGGGFEVGDPRPNRGYRPCREVVCIPNDEGDFFFFLCS